MSKKPFKRSICIFRRDLRTADHPALYNALKQSEEVLPVFFFDPRQVGKKNQYRSQHAIQFMLESLEDLDEQLQKKDGELFFFEGKPEDVLIEICNEYKIDAVFFNEDYTPFAVKRDEAIKNNCKKHNISCHTFMDLLLCDPEHSKTKQNTVYGMFTPFYKTASKNKVNEPLPLPKGSFCKPKIAQAFHKKDIWTFLESPINKHLATNGGSCQAKKLLTKLGDLKHYAKTRNIPSVDTSLLSAHLKFGTVSIRQVYYTILEFFGSKHPFLIQLYWRNFFSYLALYNPTMFGSCLKEKYNKLTWENDTHLFQLWKEGKTGFPIVDAGMRQLNRSGFMHNRIRMITASFLIKDLHIDWQWGEQYFAQQLTDYDAAVNNGNWQWSASVGIDSQPYFRIFNPWLGQKKFDPECAYIKKWIPELQHVPPTDIHNWYKMYKKYHATSYPKPIVDHAVERQKTLNLYKKANNGKLL
ncbi:deoxyribodipyrimidine photo-lyase [Candidatus Dependentiae bacterium]|nr:MAG: deoxyribodipyrimidine photo-lyase [Candidatus Dependentiae bacterium]